MRLATASLNCVALAVTAALCATANAGPYRYEMGLTGSSITTTTRSQIVFGFPDTLATSKSHIQNDLIGIGGAWYFDDVKDVVGPLQRAAFIDRASAFTLSYNHGDGRHETTFSSGDPLLPPTDFKSKLNLEEFNAGFGYVWKDSGWSIGAGIGRSELEVRGEDLAFDASSNRYSVGVGKYIGATTSLGLNVQRMETEGDYKTAAALTLTHVGDMGGTWQYSTDLSVSDEYDTDFDGAFGVGFTVHPTRTLALGLNVSGPLQNTSDGSIGYGLFASWFPKNNIGLSASYNWSDVNEPENTDIDADGWGAGIFMRF